MNCDCVEKNAERLVNHYESKGIVNATATPEFQSLNFETGEFGVSLIYTIQGENKPYNGKKGKPCHMVANFCPWCGKSAKKESE